MAVVHAAHHVLLEEPVALKMLYPDVARIPEATARFLHEARIAARVLSPNVCRIIDVGVAEDGAPYIAMERLTGMNLDELIEARRTFTVPEAVELVDQILNGVEAAHAIGVVHRDLKPANLVVTDGPVVKIIDFGVSKSNLVTELTVTGAMLGSPTHMSPEQIHDSRSVDARADIWAVGVILYELLTGVLPFEGQETATVLRQILHEPAVSLRKHRPELPEALDAVVLKCLRIAREDRYANACDVREALAPFCSASSKAASLTPWTHSQSFVATERPRAARKLRWSAEGFRIAAVACAAVVVVGTAALLALIHFTIPENGVSLATGGITVEPRAVPRVELPPLPPALVPLEDGGMVHHAQDPSALSLAKPAGHAAKVPGASATHREECPDAFICAPTY